MVIMETPKNLFSEEAQIRVLVANNEIMFERLNCMPKNANFIYPKSRFYNYHQVYESSAFDDDMMKLGLNKEKITRVSAHLFTAPSGISIKFNF